MLEFLFGWGRKIRKIRKKWDRAREKALKKEGPMKSDLLSRLDLIENKLRLLEERKSITRVERSRLSKEIEIDLEGIKEMLKMKEEEFSAQRQRAKNARNQ